MELQTFKNELFGNVRVIEENENYWFIAKDVCDALALTNTTKVIQRLDEDERTNLKLGRQGETNVINESGLYSLIMTSRKPEAKQFKKWVTSEILPSIRKNGGYIMNQENLTQEEILANALLVAQNVINDKNKRLEQLTGDNLVLEQKINELEPKASYYDLILNSPSLMGINCIAKDFGMSARTLNKLLHEYGVQYKQSGVWLLYAKHQTMGYTKSTTYLCPNGTTKLNTKWTAKGRLFIYETLKNNDILPLIESED